MRQDDKMFINLLNKIRVGQMDQNAEYVIKSRFMDKDNTSYPCNDFHTFAGNAPVKRHNENRLKNMPGKLIAIPVKDEVPKNSKIFDVWEAQNRKTLEIGGLASILELKINARVMLTTNVNLEDRLINGQMGNTLKLEIRKSKLYIWN